MQYTYLDLFIYLLIYSFLGFIAEVCVVAVKERRLCNRGFFNLPFCLSYGVIMDLLLITLPTLKGHILLQFFMILVVSSTVEYLAGSLAKRISRKTLWKYDEQNLFGGELHWLWYALLIAFFFLVVYILIHPILFMLVEIIPDWLVITICITVAALLLIDFMMILYVIRISNNMDEVEAYQNMSQQSKDKLGQRIYQLIWGRIRKAYPDMYPMEEAGESGKTKAVFAKGVCLDKLFWVFILCALGGDLIETLYCRAVMGVWMSRSSVIYGTFSIVWGIGAVLLTVVLQRLAVKDDRYVFVAGFVLGGVYEYVCSVFTEVFLGTTFWDYSHMKFNIGGRTNLLFCFFWGVLAVVWVKVCYPSLSRGIERIPPLAGKITTWILIVLMCCDALISAAAILRYTDRRENAEPDNAIEAFLDENYDDALVEMIWPKMRVQ